MVDQTSTVRRAGFPGALSGRRLRLDFKAPLRGLRLFALKIPALVLFALSLASIGYLLLGVGVLLLPAATAGLRRVADAARRLNGRWAGVEIARPYAPRPEFSAGPVGWVERVRWILTDRATWRDLAWAVTDPVVGGVAALLPAALIAYGIEGVLLPFLWHPLTSAGYEDWYALVIHVHGSFGIGALFAVPIGLASIALGLTTGPALLQLHGRWTAALLAPSAEAILGQRVEQLAATRTEVVDSQAAELRRIERDLHDGAQARLVAMGMRIGAAEQLLSSDPEAARRLLAEVKDSSSKALSELRNLVRGIHPPVLCDRGLSEAVRALALDSPLIVEVVSDVPGRVSLPVESAAYFAVSELLTNATRHSGAARVWIDLAHSDNLLRISVSDDGHGGVDPDKGSGLRGIERRLAAFDGILTLSSPESGPTMAILEIPCVLSSPKTSSS
ncbi:sensor domain-containing protein [Kitasatospora sp. NPDC096140]|uniref:sensor histidine kinase n=1 Tax=Kitasatospora sp. NPDC096140 TaxID=3155425 RepID=UPI003317802C